MTPALSTARPLWPRSGRAAQSLLTCVVIALAWLLAQGDVIAPIPGTKRVSRVEENTAADAIELSAEQIRRLNTLTPATGERHDETNMSWSRADRLAGAGPAAPG